MWELRKKGVGLLGKMKGNRRPMPFVEDTAVPPEKLADYVRDFRAILDEEGLRYGMFGHIDVGCLHVRPALDLHDPSDARRMRRVSDKVASLAKSYGGVLWGEHGTGFRSEYSPEYFGPRLFELMCKIKGAFDPTGKLNRGKLALAPNQGQSFRSIDDNHRADFDHDISVIARRHFSEALVCNGNGQCFNTDPSVVMCPSSKITRDRIHSPKGRAVVVRQWLRLLGGQSGTVATQLANRQYPADFAPLQLIERWNLSRERESRQDFSHEVYNALDGCLSCKACSTQCPLEVDIPRMKGEFLSLYHERYSRPIRDFLLASLESLLKLFGRFPRLLNMLIHNRLSRLCMSYLTGLVDLPALGLSTVNQGLRLRKLPKFDYDSLAQLTAEEKSKAVLIVQDAFTTYFEPEVVLAAVDLLSLLGYTPVLLPYFPNGKALQIKGFLRSFTALVRRNVADLEKIASLGISLIGLEPAVTLTYRDEYPYALGVEQLPFKVLLLQEWLRVRLDAIRETLAAGQLEPAAYRAYTLFGHCTEKTASPPSQTAWQEVFASFGLMLKIADVGCCGMCGVYGHEKAHVAESKGIFANELATVPRGGRGASRGHCRIGILLPPSGQALRQPSRTSSRICAARVARRTPDSEGVTIVLGSAGQCRENVSPMNLPPQEVTSQLVRRIIAFYARLSHEIGVRPLVLPDRSFFPDAFTADEKSVTKLVRRMKSYAGMDDIPVKVKVLGLDDLDLEQRGNQCCGGGCSVPQRSERAPSSTSTDETQPADASSQHCEPGACGRCDSDEQLDSPEPRLVDLGEQWLIQIPANELRNDVVLTTAIAKLIGLIFLLENLPQGSRIEEPVDTTIEVASTALGFGALLLEGSYLYTKSCGGPKIGRVTSLSCSEIAVLTALFVVRGRHKSKALKRCLGTTQSAAYRDAEALIRANRSLLAELESDAPSLASGSVTLRESTSLWNRMFGPKRSLASGDRSSNDFDIGELEAMVASTPGAPRRQSPRANDAVHDELRALVDDALAESANPVLPE